MSNIMKAIVYSAITASLATIKEDCAANKCCTCKYRDEHYACLFMKAPCKFDIDKIGKALRDSIHDDLSAGAKMEVLKSYE